MECAACMNALIQRFQAKIMAIQCQWLFPHQTENCEINDTCAGLAWIEHRWRCSWNHRTAVMAVQRGTPEPARTLPETPPRLRCAWRLSFGSFASRMPFPLTRTHGCHPVSIVSQPAPLNPSCPRILRDRLHFNDIVGCSTPPAPLSHSDLHFLPFPLAKGRK